MGVADVQTNSNLQEDIRELRNALKGLICNEKKAIEILGTRNQAQRDSIAEGYKVLFGESLHKRLKSALSGKVEKCLMLWMMSPAERDAVLLFEALREGGPHKDRAVIGMLSTRTAGHMFQIKQSYYELFNQTLENHIDGSGFIVMEPQNKSKWAFWRSSSEPKVKEPPKRAFAITKLLLALARGSRPVTTTVDRHIALTDAHQLNKVCTGKVGNEETLIRIFSTRSSSQLTATMNYYQQHYGHDFEKALSKKDAGEFLQALRAVVQCIRQPSKFYAEELSAALSGAGTDEEPLIRIITTRAEVDMHLIKMEFINERKRTLEEVIANATAGNFRQFLVAVLGQKDILISPRISNGSTGTYYMSPQVSNGSRQPSDNSDNSATSYFSGSVGSSGQNSFQS
ncbi:hypothetical protein M758_9G089400 [Ceratodon purpureus]|nr:hypothetical protein M758_9G089400 [Ceratodon purpureus]